MPANEDEQLPLLATGSQDEQAAAAVAQDNDTVLAADKPVGDSAANTTLNNSAAADKPKALRDMSTKEAYFASLEAWLAQANISQNAMAMFPWYLMTCYPQLFQNQFSSMGVPFHYGAMSGPNMAKTTTATVLPQGTAVPPNLQQQQQQQTQTQQAAQQPAAGYVGAGLRYLDERAQLEIINRHGGYEYVIAPFWKRAAAEFIDIVILLLLKIIVTFTIMNLFDLDLGFELDKDILQMNMDDDDYSSFLIKSMDFLAFSSDLLLLEVLTKVVVCCYEAFWTTFFQGATPGKAILNIRIVYVEAVHHLPQAQQPAMQMPAGFPFQNAQRGPMHALLFPAEKLGLRRAFMRAIAKNLIMTLLFPICFIMVFFKNNRTAYDVMTKTVVVETNANAVLRRLPLPQQ